MRNSPSEAPTTNSSPLATRWVALAEQLMVCERTLQGVLAPLAATRQLSPSQLWLLLACRTSSSGGLGQSQLAASLAVSPAQVSTLVEQLRAKGLLEGRRGEPDRRRQFWRLTPAGEAILRGTLADLADWAAAVDDRLGSDRCAALARLLSQLSGVLRPPLSEATPPASELRPFDPAHGCGEGPPGASRGTSGRADGDTPRRAAS